MPRFLTLDEVRVMPWNIFPVLMLTDRPGLVPWAIEKLTSKGREPGRYNHAATLYEQGKVAEQCWQFRQTPIEDYLSGKYRLKFWFNPEWTPTQKNAMRKAIMALLKQRGKYDYGGVGVQAEAKILHLPFLKHVGIPGRDYCSEAMVKVFRIAEPAIFTDDHASPADLDRACKAAPQMRAWVYDPRV